MGLYDTIEDELFCPFCGAKIKGFQTKDLGQNMFMWTIKEIKSVKTRKWKDDTRIYTHCDKCGEWVEIVIIGESHDDNLLKLIEEKIKSANTDGDKCLFDRKEDGTV